MRNTAFLLLAVLLSCGQSQNFSIAKLPKAGVVTTGFIERNSSYQPYSASVQLEDSTGRVYAVHFFIDSAAKRQNLLMLFVRVEKPEPSQPEEKKTRNFGDDIKIASLTGCPVFLMDSIFTVLHYELLDYGEESLISEGTIDFMDGNFYGIGHEVHLELKDEYPLAAEHIDSFWLIDVNAATITRLPGKEVYRDGDHYYKMGK